jgi:hypothetical protein
MKTIKIVSTNPACVTVSQNGEVLTTITHADNLTHAVGMAILMCDPLLPRLADFIWYPDSKRKNYIVGGSACSGFGKTFSEAYGFYFLTGCKEEGEFEDWEITPELSYEEIEAIV